MCAGWFSAEVPSGWPLAALEAQAVASRTYALTAHAGARSSTSTRTRARRSTAAWPRRRRRRTPPWRRPPGRSSPIRDARRSRSSSPARAGARRTSRARSPALSPSRGCAGCSTSTSSAICNSWKLSLSFAAAAARLRGLVRGRFQGIEVLKRGFSPRISSAYVLGSSGRTLVSGAELARAWACSARGRTSARATARASRRFPRPQRPAG